MDPTHDNLLIRAKAFFGGLGALSLFAILLVAVAILAVIFDFGKKGEAPEDAAAVKRYETRAAVEQAQVTVLSDEQIAAATAEVAKAIVAAKPLAIEKPEQLVPGSPTALGLADAPATDLSGIDDLVDPDAPIDEAVMELGKASYLVCGACHGQNGEGGPAGPPLADSEWVTGPISNLILIQLRGLTGPIMVNGILYDQFPAGMMPMAYQTDEQIAGVLTYIRNSFGNQASLVTPEQVAALRGEVGKPQVTVEDLIQP